MKHRPWTIHEILDDLIAYVRSGGRGPYLSYSEAARRYEYLYPAHNPGVKKLFHDKLGEVNIQYEYPITHLIVQDDSNVPGDGFFKLLGEQMGYDVDYRYMTPEGKIALCNQLTLGLRRREC